MKKLKMRVSQADYDQVKLLSEKPYSMKIGQIKSVLNWSVGTICRIKVSPSWEDYSKGIEAIRLKYVKLRAKNTDGKQEAPQPAGDDGMLIGSWRNHMLSELINISTGIETLNTLIRNAGGSGKFRLFR